MNRLRQRLDGRTCADAGFTLIELLVAVVIAGIMGSILITVLLSAQTSAKATTSREDLTGEARVALNRITDDLRQATPTFAADGTETPGLVSVQNPYASTSGYGYVPGAVTSVTLQADFDGDSCVGTTPIQTPGTCPSPGATAGPETETVCWGGNSDPALYLVAGTVVAGSCTPTDGTVPQPLLSGKVTAFTLTFTSNLYPYQESNGITYWWDLDAAGPPVGDSSNTLTTAELVHVNAVSLQVTMQDAGHTQSYQTSVALRNVS